MAKTYRLTSTANAILINGTQTAHTLTTGAGSGTEVLLAPQASGQVTRYFLTDTASDPGSSGATGDYSVVLNVSVAASGTTLAVRLHRLDSAGTSLQESSLSSSQSAATTGDKTFSFTAQNLGTWGATNLFAIFVVVTNTNSHGGDAGPTLNLAAANTRVDTPFGSTTFTAKPQFFLMWGQTLFSWALLAHFVHPLFSALSHLVHPAPWWRPEHSSVSLSRSS